MDPLAPPLLAFLYEFWMDLTHKVSRFNFHIWHDFFNPQMLNIHKNLHQKKLKRSSEYEKDTNYCGKFVNSSINKICKKLQFVIFLSKYSMKHERYSKNDLVLFISTQLCLEVSLTSYRKKYLTVQNIYLNEK